MVNDLVPPLSCHYEQMALSLLPIDHFVPNTSPVSIRAKNYFLVETTPQFVNNYYASK